MAKIIRFGSDRHSQTQESLPWYVMGRLDESENAQVEAHLADCASCRRDLEAERGLAADIVSLPLDVDVAWAALRPRLRERSQSRSLQRARAAIGRIVLNPPRLAWFIAAQALFMVVAATALTVLPRRTSPEYHALSEEPAHIDGNMIAIFRPDISEARFRDTLIVNHARLVNGPTASGAYILAVPMRERPRILANLQNSKDVVLAQPLDEGTGR